MIIALMLFVGVAIGIAVYVLIVKSRFYVGDLYLPRDVERTFSILMFFNSREQVESMTRVLREMRSGFEFEFREGSTPAGSPTLSCEFSAMPNGIRLSRLQTKVKRLGGRYMHLSVLFGPFEPRSL
jgi:hypothetical protein